jgi:hypothetical protein
MQSTQAHPKSLSFRTGPQVKGCHSEPGPKPGEEPAVRAVTARVERTLLSVAFDLAVAFELKGSPAGATVEERRFSAA